MRTPGLVGLPGLAVGALLTAGAALAPVTAVATTPAEPPPAAAEIDPALAGRHLFESFCSNCHGDEARGDGPLADLLRIVTPDLTRLADRNGGDFPAEHVRTRIDGTEEVQAHGRRMMPVWGQALDSGHGESGKRTAGRQLAEIVSYLESIQETD